MRLGGWRVPGEPAVAPPTVRIPSALQIQLPVLGARQREFLLSSPLIYAHHKNLHGRLVLDPVIDSLEPVIVPAELGCVRVHQRLLAEIDLAIFARRPMS